MEIRKVVSSEGEVAPEEELQTMYLIFKGDEYKSEENKSFKKLMLDVSSEPFKIDLDDAKGIYRFVDKDTIEIYWTKNALPRPKEFTAPKGRKTIIYTLKRKMQKE